MPPPTAAPPPAPTPVQARSPTGPTPPVTAGRTAGTRITNANYHSDFAEFRTLNLTLKKVRERASAKNLPIPQNGQATEMCLSYHVQGFCWDNCSRLQDHKTHTPDEHKRLKEWCKECYRSSN
jgi:hypothetical protein